VIVIIFEVLIVVLALLLNPAAKRRKQAQGLDQNETIESQATVTSPTDQRDGSGGKEDGKRINPEILPHEGERRNEGE